jgi:allantoin racemase
MRLLYQSLGVSRGTQSGAYAEALRRIVGKAASNHSEITINGLSPHRALADQYRYLEFLDTTEILDRGLQAERESYDAFLIGNIFEPGLHELRELLNIPVLGLRESVVHVACLMGATFSLINVNPKFQRRIVEGIKLQGLETRMASIETMTIERPGVFDSAFEDDSARTLIVEEFRKVAQRALSRGAEVLIPAGGSLMTVLTEAGVCEVDGAPVVNGVIALVKIAELAVDMRRLAGSFTSKHLIYAPPKGKLLADVRAAYGEHIYPGAK